MLKNTLKTASLVSILLLPGFAAAQTLWTGPNDGKWSDTDNWEQGLPDLTKGANISPSEPLQIQVGSPAQVQGIQKGGVADLVLSGSAITLGSGYDGTFNSVLVNGGNLTINNNLVSTQNKRITLNEGGKSLTLNGDLETSDQTTQIGNLGTGTLAFNGNRSGGNSLVISEGEVVARGILSNRGGGNTQVRKGAVVVSSRDDGPTIESGSKGLVLTPEGVFRFAAPDQIAGFLNLSGGTLDLAGFSNDEVLIANLTLTDDSVIDFSNSANEALVVGDLSENTNWKQGATLRIVGFSAGDSLQFGDSAEALTKDQLAAIKFDGKAAQIDSEGNVTPVP
jgi:hypothetical protein